MTTDLVTFLPEWCPSKSVVTTYLIEQRFVRTTYRFLSVQDKQGPPAKETSKSMCNVTDISSGIRKLVVLGEPGLFPDLFL